MSRKLTMKIGEQEITCDFGVNYFYKYAKEVAGIDMLADSIPNIVTADGIETVARLVFAGHKAETAMRKEQPLITVDDVEHHYMSMDVTPFIESTKEVFKAINPEKKEDGPGEALTQAAQP